MRFSEKEELDHIHDTKCETDYDLTFTCSAWGHQ